MNAYQFASYVIHCACSSVHDKAVKIHHPSNSNTVPNILYIRIINSV